MCCNAVGGGEGNQGVQRTPRDDQASPLQAQARSRLPPINLFPDQVDIPPEMRVPPQQPQQPPQDGTRPGGGSKLNPPEVPEIMRKVLASLRGALGL